MVSQTLSAPCLLGRYRVEHLGAAPLLEAFGTVGTATQRDYRRVSLAQAPSIRQPHPRPTSEPKLPRHKAIPSRCKDQPREEVYAGRSRIQDWARKAGNWEARRSMKYKE